MHTRRRTRAILACLMAGSLLFAQAIGVAQACIEATQSPTMAFADTYHEGDCGKTVNKNACLQQYTAGDQSTAQVQAAVAEMPKLAVLVVPAALDPGACFPEVVLYPVHSPDPPPSLRFCSFQL
jgi:hypothetical protein